MKPFRYKTSWVLAAISILCASLVCSIPTSAHTTPKSAKQSTSNIVVDLAIDCTKTMQSPSARLYALQHGICVDTIVMPDSVSPDTTVTGSCGSATLTMSAAGGGTVNFYQQVTSYLGPMTYLSDTVSWQNISRGNTGSFSNTQHGLSTTWVKNNFEYTGPGTITGTMINLNVRLVWGAWCQGLMPTSQTYAY